MLVEGYSDVLVPERHYISVRHDLSDIEEALERLRDLNAVEAMTERAYREVYLEGRNTLRSVAQPNCATSRGVRPGGSPFHSGSRDVSPCRAFPTHSPAARL